MGTMRPNKYDVTTSNLLCQDFVPPDGGCCGSIMQQRPNLSLFEMCQQVCWNNSRWKTISIRQHWLWSPTRKSLSSTMEIITISHHMDSFPIDGSDNLFKLTLFLEKNQTYLCFTKKWRLVTMKNLHESCYFYETLENGWFQYRSAMNEKIFLGFTKNGRPVRNKAPHLNTDCYNFQKMDLVQNKTVENHQSQHKNRRKKGPQKKKQQQPRRRHGSLNMKRLIYTTTTTTTTTPKYTTTFVDSNNSNVKELDLQLFTDYTYDDYLNLAKKQKVIPKKVTNNNSGLLPKLRHANRRKGGKRQRHTPGDNLDYTGW